MSDPRAKSSRPLASLLVIHRHQTTPAFDRCEDRTLTTLVFVLNGNSFNAAKPNSLTANAVSVLKAEGNQVVQLSNPAIHSPGAVNKLAAQVMKQARGQTVGLVGFSAGGALALRIAATPGLKVSSVLDYYGVPDVRAFLNRHATDHQLNPIAGLSPFKSAVVNRLSGPLTTSAHVVAAFGQADPHVTATTSAADLKADHPGATVYTYAGGHGVGITAGRPALDDFLAHLG